MIKILYPLVMIYTLLRTSSPNMSDWRKETICIWGVIFLINIIKINKKEKDRRKKIKEEDKKINEEHTKIKTNHKSKLKFKPKIKSLKGKKINFQDQPLFYIGISLLLIFTILKESVIELITIIFISLILFIINIIKRKRESGIYEIKGKIKKISEKSVMIGELFLLVNKQQIENINDDDFVLAEVKKNSNESKNWIAVKIFNNYKDKKLKLHLISLSVLMICFIFNKNFIKYKNYDVRIISNYKTFINHEFKKNEYLNLKNLKYYTSLDNKSIYFISNKKSKDLDFENKLEDIYNSIEELKKLKKLKEKKTSHYNHNINSSKWLNFERKYLENSYIDKRNNINKKIKILKEQQIKEFTSEFKMKNFFNYNGASIEENEYIESIDEIFEKNYIKDLTVKIISVGKQNSIIKISFPIIKNTKLDRLKQEQKVLLYLYEIIIIFLIFSITEEFSKKLKENLKLQKN